MKKTALVVLMFFGITFFSSRAFMDSTGKNHILYEIPVPPLKGRTSHHLEKYISKPEKSYSHWLKDGKRYFARKEFEQAILAFRKALKIKPLSGEAHFLLGVAYEKRGSEGLPGDLTSWNSLAENAYRAAIALEDSLPARFNLACLLTRLGRYNEAKKELEHIILVAPNSRLGKKASKLLSSNFDNYLLPKTLTQEFSDLME